MIVLDISIVVTGQPRIRESLGFSAVQLSWVHSAYTLATELALGEEAAIKTDVTQADQVQALIDRAVRLHGRVDVLLNNAGLMPHSPLERLKIDDWDRMIDVNIKGVLYGIAAALPQMKAQRSGHIINVSPGAVAAELPDSITEADVAGGIKEFYARYAIPADSFARMVAFAISQPEDVDVTEILFRPTSQKL
ncbi:MAG: SDR family NAD(P)-dependent oxidoreductase [Magnetospirillum sp.]|nr:SDR family NAD(P)-dependent oxidoreductase [Magnetospirillum sp.]